MLWSEGEYMGDDRGLLLLIEDDLDVSDTLSELLKDDGFAVSTAHNGRHALEQLHAGLSQGH